MDPAEPAGSDRGKPGRTPCRARPAVRRGGTGVSCSPLLLQRQRSPTLRGSQGIGISTPASSFTGSPGRLPRVTGAATPICRRLGSSLTSRGLVNWAQRSSADRSPTTHELGLRAELRRLRLPLRRSPTDDHCPGPSQTPTAPRGARRCRSPARDPAAPAVENCHRRDLPGLAHKATLPKAGGATSISMLPNLDLANLVPARAAGELDDSYWSGEPAP
jgi:hypothetical protein